MNFQFLSEDKRKISKTVLVLWTPDNASAKNKFLYSSCKKPLLIDFQNVQVEVQASCAKDMSFDNIKDKILLSEH